MPFGGGVAFELQGEQFSALNPRAGLSCYQRGLAGGELRVAGGDRHYWEELAANEGEQIQCGWLKDTFGMPWQIVPGKVWDWLREDDPARVRRVTSPLWQMRKLSLAELERAAEG